VKLQNLQKFRHSLKFRITAIILLLQALMLAAVLGVTLNVSLKENTRQWEIKEQVMMSLLGNLSRVALLTGEYDDLQPYVEEAVSDPHIDSILIANKDGRIVVSNEFIMIGRTLPDLKNWKDKRWVTSTISNSAGNLGQLAIRFSHASLMASNREVLNLGITIAMVGMVLVAIIGALIGFLLTRRLEVLTDSAQRMAKGELSVRTGLGGKDEVAIVGQAFDQMARNVEFNIDALKRLTDELEQRVEQRTTELAEARDAAIQADRSKSAFLANMSHEIRTPLTAIIGFSESLLDSNQSMDERVTSIATIIHSGKHLLQIINDILDLSKIEADKLEVYKAPINPFDVIEDVANIVHLLAESKGLLLKTEYDSLLPEKITTDPLRLKQILINLCNNAIKFTEEGSVRIKIECNRAQEELIIKVIDTGVGLTEEQIERLFKPFSQADNSASRKYGGTGLGLHLSRELARKLDGAITVESTPYVGSCFTLTVSTGPLANTNFIAPPNTRRKDGSAPVESQSAQRLAGHVLLAEDNPDNQRLIMMMLKKAGAEVDLAENGHEAVVLARANDYDLVLMDIQMPVMNGLDAIRELRSQGYDKPIVSLTANAMQIDIDACFAAGCDDFAAKPIDREKFYGILVKYLLPAEAAEVDLTPIISTLLQEEPDIADLLQGFIDKLPQKVTQLRKTLEGRDKQKLAAEIHDLKGVSGNYGYKVLFELCQKMEFEVLAGRLNGLPEMLSRMEQLIERIRLGLPDNVLPISGKIEKPGHK